MGTHLIGQQLFLGLIAVFEELLDDIIPKYISHQLARVRVELAKDLILLIAVGGLQLLLDESRSMLVTAELDDVIVNILALVNLGLG